MESPSRNIEDEPNDGSTGLAQLTTAVGGTVDEEPIGHNVIENATTRPDGSEQEVEITPGVTEQKEREVTAKDVTSASAFEGLSLDSLALGTAESFRTAGESIARLLLKEDSEELPFLPFFQVAARLSSASRSLREAAEIKTPFETHPRAEHDRSKPEILRTAPGEASDTGLRLLSTWIWSQGQFDYFWGPRLSAGGTISTWLGEPPDLPPRSRYYSLLTRMRVSSQISRSPTFPPEHEIGREFSLLSNRVSLDLLLRYLEARLTFGAYLSRGTRENELVGVSDIESCLNSPRSFEEATQRVEIALTYVNPPDADPWPTCLVFLLQYFELRIDDP